MIPQIFSPLLEPTVQVVPRHPPQHEDEVGAVLGGQDHFFVVELQAGVQVSKQETQFKERRTKAKTTRTPKFKLKMQKRTKVLDFFLKTGMPLYQIPAVKVTRIFSGKWLGKSRKLQTAAWKQNRWFSDIYQSVGTQEP